MINKYLYLKGGAETYMLGLGEALQAAGHEVQYFGMDQEERTCGNRVGAYARRVDFHHGGARWISPVTTIYSGDVRRQLRRVLEDFQPESCHLHNFNYQLTPGVILEIERWRRETGRRCSMVYTAHDYQLICPNHMLYRMRTGEPCRRCLSGHFLHCVAGRCIHGSAARSAVGALEASLWHGIGVYRHIDAIICCSGFMKTLLDFSPVLSKKTLVLHNFVKQQPALSWSEGSYVLYFGRLAEEKGIRVLLKVCGALSDIPFILAGTGPMAAEAAAYPNVRCVGFQQGEALTALIREARLTVCPSVWYENCPMSVLESLALGTPVVGARIGGIPELIRPGLDGALFESGDAEDLRRQIAWLWEHPLRPGHGDRLPFDTADEYLAKLLPIYQGKATL